MNLKDSLGSLDQSRGEDAEEYQDYNGYFRKYKGMNLTHRKVKKIIKI